MNYQTLIPDLNQVSLNSWPIYRKLPDQHLGYLLNFSDVQRVFTRKGI